MSNQIDPQNYEAPLIYQIRIKGHLLPQWTEWFDNATISREADGSTLLTCTIIDQAALHGLLKKVRDFGLPLLSVNRLDADQEDSPNT